LLSGLDRWLAPAPDAARIAWLREQIYAHRGLHGGGRVENSPSAFAAAIAAGIAIECDVQASADGRVVVFHDADLDRLTGESGAVAARPASELTRVVLSGSADRIPTLRDLVTYVDGRVPLLIEVKSRGKRPVSRLCRAVMRDLEGYRGAHAIMSFDQRVPKWLSRHAPRTVRGLVVTEANARTLAGALGRRLALWHARPDFLAYDLRDLPSGFAEAQRARGLPLLTWTVSTRRQLERAQACADGPIAEAEGLAAALERH
jgi:glycerophosphoryl diester phosphodiesterase